MTSTGEDGQTTEVWIDSEERAEDESTTEGETEPADDAEEPAEDETAKEEAESEAKEEEKTEEEAEEEVEEEEPTPAPDPSGDDAAPGSDAPAPDPSLPGPGGELGDLGIPLPELIVRAVVIAPGQKGRPRDYASNPAPDAETREGSGTGSSSLGGLLGDSFKQGPGGAVVETLKPQDYGTGNPDPLASRTGPDGLGIR